MMADLHGHRNVDLDEFPEIKDLLTPFCTKDFFDRRVLGHIKLAFLRGSQDTTKSLRGDLEAVAVAADKTEKILRRQASLLRRRMTEGYTGRGFGTPVEHAFQRGADRLREALAGPGVQAMLEGVKDG